VTLPEANPIKGSRLALRHTPKACPAGLCAVCALIAPIAQCRQICARSASELRIGMGGDGSWTCLKQWPGRGLTNDAKTTSSFRILSHMCLASASINLPQHKVKGNGCGEALLDSRRLRAGLKVAPERCQPP